MDTEKESVNRAKPKVTIILGGKERSLKLNLNAMVAFENITGISFRDSGEGGQMSPKYFRAMLWACLLHEVETDENDIPVLTLKEVGDWVDVGNLTEVNEKLNEAFDASMLDRQGKKGVRGKGPLARKARRG